MDDLELAVATLLYKTPAYTKLWNYYMGHTPLVYASQGLSELFQNISARFSQNWCAVVVDSVQDRIQLQRILVADDEGLSDALALLLASSELVLMSEDVHLAALVTGESYVIAWPDEITGEPEAYYNDSRNVHLFYEADKPRRKRYGVKWWLGDDNYRYLTLYYADKLEYYRSTNAVRSDEGVGSLAWNEVTSGKGFTQIDTETNPYGLIPVFHFRRERRIISSELANVLGPQDAVNKILSDMMIAAEFGAFPQRYIISQAEPGKFKNAPNVIWDIPGSDGEGQPTTVGQFASTELSNYLAAIDKWTTAIAIISRTPKHYFFGQGGDPSGEALIAMEAPLNHKAQKYITRFIAGWSEVAQFMMMVAGLGVVDDNAIIPIFEQPETVQPYTQALIRKESVAAGIPLMWQMEQEGYTEQELDDLEAAMQEEQNGQQQSLATALTNAQRNFDQNGAGINNNGT
jgi:Phage portal protein, SPP1 Gp6-like